MPKRTINGNFFKKLTQDSAYILGYIAADGCLIKRKNRKNSWILSITSKDGEHLEKMRNVLLCDYPVLKKFNGSGGLCYHLQITSSEIARDLLKWGIYPRKTFNLQPIKVPRLLLRDFVRGYFDADGSVYIYVVNGTPQLKVGICGASCDFISSLSRDICEEIGRSLKPIHAQRGRKGRRTLYSFDFYVNDGRLFYNFIYGHRPKLYLERKFRVFEDWKFVKRRKYNFRTSTLSVAI